VSTRHRHQRGQAVVVVSAAMIALLAMLALVLMGGSLYWERRHLQELADSGALAGSIQAGGLCSLAQAQTVANGARNVLEAQLGPASPPSVTGGCTAPGYVFTYTFTNGATAAVNWPYSGGQNDKVGVTMRHSMGLQLAAFVGSSATVVASAVAQASNFKSPLNYAVFAYDGVTCGGSSVNFIRGSVYSGTTIDTSCGWYVEEVKNGSTFIDYGDILAYDTQPGWERGGGQCLGTGPVGNAICADGYEISGHPTATCATNYPAGTEYVDTGQLVPIGGVVPNPKPCPGISVPAPSWSLTPDPNSGPSALNQNGAPCPVGGASISDTSYPQVNVPGGRGPVARASNGNVTPRAVPAPTLGPDGLYHFHPGCYAWIDVANVPGGTAVLDPGFYHFNGFYVPSGKNADPSAVAAGGIALATSNSRILGRGVTLEFANPAGGASSFSGSQIEPAQGNPSACGGGQSCYMGADPAAPVAGYTYFSAPCSSNDPSLDSRCPTSTVPSWCLQVGTSSSGSPVYDLSCYDVLVWAPPPPGPPAPIGGSLWFKGQGSYEWAYGIIQWPGNCGWSANGSSVLIGELICDTVSIQGGTFASGPAVQYGSTAKNVRPNEASLLA
jgi:Putative Flp pilus-assembly TadE/G-like